MRRKEFDERIGLELADSLRELEADALSRGLKVRVRSVEGSPTGDFTIFIYDKSVMGCYMVGFDGNFDGSCGLSFEYCLNQARSWIDSYKK